MTHREVLARAQIVSKIKKIRSEMNLPPDPILERLLFAGTLVDIEGLYQGLLKMAAVYQRNRGSSSAAGFASPSKLVPLHP